MQSSAENLPDLPLEYPSNESTYVLHELEVFNWGPFGGFHQASIDPRGTAIIGPTGSGKTTLIDGLMTLLVAQPKYNLASTGGHESDRTLISYVRGVLGGDGSSAKDDVARPGKTWTGLCATYRSGDKTLKLGTVLWTDGSSNAAQDLKRRWIFSLAEDESLEDWLRLAHDEGVRHLMQHGRDTAQLRIFDSKKAYLAHVRKFFDVGDNAFTLLNRAAGLKQLNSIDEIFRDLVLDDRSAFARAREVAGEFDNLAEIHAELETARRQRESLVPIAKESDKLDKARKHEALWSRLKQILPVWFALEGVRKWTTIIETHNLEHNEASTKHEAAKEQEKILESEVEILRESYLQLGGNVIGELEKTIEQLAARVSERRKISNSYLSFAKQLDLDQELSATALERNKAILRKRQPELEQLRDSKHEQALDAHSHLRDEKARVADISSSLDKARRRPGSNIRTDFQDFRSALAEQLSLDDDDLPFVAELLEVQPGESQWRGAIERAIGSERLRILVPESHLDTALRWVNNRHNRLHVRLLRALTDAPFCEFFSDGFTRKLNFKKHPRIGTVKELLAARDRHCVNSPEELKRTEFGMTVQGLMSGRDGWFEKQDQQRLDQGWMTGFDNKDQLKALENELREGRDRVNQWTENARQYQQELKALDDQLTIFKELLQLEFPIIDLPSAEADLAFSEKRLRDLSDPTSDAGKAKQRFEEQSAKLTKTRTQISEIESTIAVVEERRKNAQTQKDRTSARAEKGLTEDDLQYAAKELPIDPTLPVEKLDDEERRTASKIDERLATQQNRVQAHEKRLINLMGIAQREDTGALAETDMELQDIPNYLDRLRVLEEESLPEKLVSFLKYLNQSSDQGVTQLLSGITEEVDGIEHRIMELNETLKKVEFRSGRYLQLVPQPIQHERLRSLIATQRHLRSAALKDDQGESQFKALRAMVEILREASDNPRQLGSRALLDPRYRLQFFVVEVDLETGARSPQRSGSQSGSGGEKELMASHILTASLSYALCPSGASRPLYGTVVLDEAFSKSSPSAASRIIEALRIFGLHPIFVTPNKEIGLLKKHTRKVICVQRPRKQATVASITWEKLDELAHPK